MSSADPKLFDLLTRQLSVEQRRPVLSAIDRDVAQLYLRFERTDATDSVEIARCQAEIRMLKKLRGHLEDKI